MAYKDIDKKREYDKKYFSNPDNIKRIKDYENSPIIRERKRIYSREYYKKNKRELNYKQTIYLRKPEIRDRNNKKRRERDAEHKLRVYNHYSNYDIKCNCCGEREMDFLSIDHINNDGNTHRKVVKEILYRWLYSNNFPPGFQILCMNCNMSKHKDKNHICAHKRTLMKLLGY